MHKIKVLWLSNKLQSSTNDSYTGSWLNAMAEGLTRSGAVELGNMSRGRVSKITRQDFGEIGQWTVPFAWKFNRSPGLLSNDLIREIEKVTNDYCPDLIQIWGTEDVWGLLTARKHIEKPALLEMQGLRGAIARVFEGGLRTREQLACIGLKELLKRSTIFHERQTYQKWERVDKEIISGHRFIAVQTEWMEAQVKRRKLIVEVETKSFQ